MNPYYQDAWLTVYGGDCREVMRTMEPESVHCVVTSPPYWGLRDYGTAEWMGGDPACIHRVPATGSTQNKGNNNHEGKPFRGECGAVRVDRQLGLEATPEEYVANLVDVFREVRRVLRPDGTVWLNLGDSYAGSGKGPSNNSELDRPHRGMSNIAAAPTRWLSVPAGVKGKDLVGIPWMVAFALRSDGWYLRSDIIWSKPNPMPESIRDRPTKAHEYVFLLSRSPQYYYNGDAIRERSVGQNEHDRRWDATEDAGTAPLTRNRRSVWTVATQPYPDAHYATFPEALIEPMILAGCPEGGTMLDPFGGSGTVGRVAQRFSRHAVLIDLNPDYLVQVMERNRDIPMGLVG